MRLYIVLGIWHLARSLMEEEILGTDNDDTLIGRDFVSYYISDVRVSLRFHKEFFRWSRGWRYAC